MKMKQEPYELFHIRLWKGLTAFQNSIFGIYFIVFPLPAGDYISKVNNRNTRTRCKICSKSTIKAPERRLRNFVSYVIKMLLSYINLYSNQKTLAAGITWILFVFINPFVPNAPFLYPLKICFQE